MFTRLVLVCVFLDNAAATTWYGPTDKIWQLEKEISALPPGTSVTGCQQACVSTPTCTAINYNTDPNPASHGECQLRAVANGTIPSW
jgi:hypothetical protein